MKYFRKNAQLEFMAFFMVLEIPDELSKRLATGDEAAFREFYDLTAEAVKSYILYRSSGDKEACMDIMAEVFLDAYKYRTRLKTHTNIAAWLYTIARHKIMDHFRARRRQEKIIEKKKNYLSLEIDSQKQFKPDEIYFEKHENYGLRAALLLLDEEERIVLTAKYINDESVREIAQKRNKTEKAIENILYRARKNFAASVQKISEEKTYSADGVLS